MSYKAPEYNPSPFVVATHNIFHVNPTTGEIVDNTFSINQEYFMSLATIPVAILVIGIIAILLLFLISNCCAPGTCFWKYFWYYICCCFCCPPKIKEDVDLDKKREAWFAAQAKAVKLCYGVLSTLLSCAAFVWLGDADITKGMDGIVSASELLRDTISGIFGSISAMFTNISGISNSFTSGESCDLAWASTTYASVWTGITSSITSATDSLSSAGTQIDSLSTPIFDGLDVVKENIDSAKPQKDRVVLLVFFGCLALCFLNFLTIWRKNAYISCVVSIVNYVLMILLLIVCSVIMVIVMLIADFCMDPSAAILSVAGGAADTVRYYTSCEGTSSFTQYLTILSNNLQVLKNQVGSPQTPAGNPQTIYEVEYYMDQANACPPSGCYTCSTDLNAKINAIQAEIESIDTYLGCAGINPVYDQLINRAFCTDSFSGVYKLWGDFYFMALFIFVLLCCISKLYQYMISDDDAETKKPWIKAHYRKAATSEEQAHIQSGIEMIHSPNDVEASQGKNGIVVVNDM